MRVAIALLLASTAQAQPLSDNALVKLLSGDRAVAAIYAALHTNPLGATHGFGYPLRWSTPLIAIYGAAKSLVFAPYPYEASWPRVIGCFSLGAAALAALIFLARDDLPYAEGEGVPREAADRSHPPTPR